MRENESRDNADVIGNMSNVFDMTNKSKEVGVYRLYMAIIYLQRTDGQLP